MQMLAIGKWSKALKRWSMVVPIRRLVPIPARASEGESRRKPRRPGVRT
jgi:hypothetical protein